MNENNWLTESGEPDAEIQLLENLLSQLGHQPDKTHVLRIPRPTRLPLLLAAAASLLVIAGALWMVWQRSRPAWQVATVAGSPSVKRLAKGQSLSTDAQSRARLDLDEVGQVDVEPNTQLSVLTLREDEQRLALAHGTIPGRISAPPGRFFVNTPSAQCVGLACEYTVNEDGSGVGLVAVR